MREILRRLSLEKFWAKRSNGGLFLSAAAVLALFGADLFIMDPLPFVDEAVLGLLLSGVLSEMMSRGRSRRLGKGASPPTSEGVEDPQSHPELGPVGSDVKSLVSRAAELSSVLKELRHRGANVPPLPSLKGLGKRCRELAASLQKHDAFLARRDNDPWQIQRSINKLERRVAEAELARLGDELGVAQAQLQSSEAHLERVGAERLEREAVRVRMAKLSSELAVLIEDLRALSRNADYDEWRLLGLQAVDPRLTEAVQTVRETRIAERELEEALEGGGTSRDRTRGSAASGEGSKGTGTTGTTGTGTTGTTGTGTTAAAASTAATPAVVAGGS